MSLANDILHIFWNKELMQWSRDDRKQNNQGYNQQSIKSRRSSCVRTCVTVVGDVEACSYDIMSHFSGYFWERPHKRLPALYGCPFVKSHPNLDKCLEVVWSTMVQIIWCQYVVSLVHSGRFNWNRCQASCYKWDRTRQDTPPHIEYEGSTTTIYGTLSSGAW